VCVRVCLGFLKVVGFGKGSKGGQTKATIYFPTDPGYRDTARMLVESGLALALDIDKIRAPGGVWTPATCQVFRVVCYLNVHDLCGLLYFYVYVLTDVGLLMICFHFRERFC
jgi:hypothetical protein